jgi:hypothetical protein
MWIIALRRLTGRGGRSCRRRLRNPLGGSRIDVQSLHMDDRDDIEQPRDHLPPRVERDGDDAEAERPYPDATPSEARSTVTPATAAEPEKPNRHGVDRLPPTGR